MLPDNHDQNRTIFLADEYITKLPKSRNSPGYFLLIVFFIEGLLLCKCLDWLQLDGFLVYVRVDIRSTCGCLQSGVFC